MHEQIDLVPNAYSRSGPAQARHASRKGAEKAASRAENLSARYIALLQDHPEGLTDWQAKVLLGVERSTVNARRDPLVKAGVIVANGLVKDEHSDVANTRWQLASLRKKESDHGSVGVDGDTRRLGKTPPMYFGDRSREANVPATERRSDPVNASESTPRRKPHYEVLSTDRQTGPTGSVGKPGQNRHAANPPRILTRETAATVAFNTRVRFADGSFGQLRMLMKNGDLAVYVFDLRETIYLKPSTLIDRRESDGELVEI